MPPAPIYGVSALGKMSINMNVTIHFNVLIDLIKFVLCVEFSIHSLLRKFKIGLMGVDVVKLGVNHPVIGSH